jgi:transcription initiation factor IIE alpha subunit
MPSKYEERIMAKLTDTQLIMLSKAAARDDGIAVVPAKMNKAAASKVGASLLARKLMRELRSKPGMPVWREDDDGRSISLMITRAGRDAIGVDEDEQIKQAPRSDKKPATRSPSRSNGDGSKSSTSTPSRLNVASPRAGSKQALVTEMLGAKGGATLDALVNATGWLPHTTRAALTGLRKRGFSIERTREAGEASMYRIAWTPASNRA